MYVYVCVASQLLACLRQPALGMQVAYGAERHRARGGGAIAERPCDLADGLGTPVCVCMYACMCMHVYVCQSVKLHKGGPWIHTEPSGDCRKYLPPRTCSAPLPGMSGTTSEPGGPAPEDDDAAPEDDDAAPVPLRLPLGTMPADNLCVCVCVCVCV